MDEQDKMAYVRSYRGRGVLPRPDGRTAYADPGLLPDGKPRYPLDSEEHVRAAYHHLRQSPDRYDRAGEAQVHRSLGHAMRRHGVDPYAEVGMRVMNNQEEGSGESQA